jgi:hypothetical protein
MGIGTMGIPKYLYPIQSELEKYNKDPYPHHYSSSLLSSSIPNINHT